MRASACCPSRRQGKETLAGAPLLPAAVAPIRWKPSRCGGGSHIARTVPLANVDTARILFDGDYPRRCRRQITAASLEVGLGLGGSTSGPGMGGAGAAGTLIFAVGSGAE